MGGGVEKSLKTWALILLLPENRGSLLAYPRGFHFSSILSFFCILLPKNKGSSFLVDVPKNDGKILFQNFSFVGGIQIWCSSFLEIYPKSKGCSHFLTALLNFETQ